MDNLEVILKALADKKRLKILKLLSKQEMAVCEIINELDLSQPAVSHHLKLLKNAGLVRDIREGKWIYYTINANNFSNYYDKLSGFMDEVLLNINQGVASSPIRNQPCLCEKLKAKKM